MNALMDFKDQLKQLGQRIAKLKDSILTEEAAKNAFVLPFIQLLGYDVFNPFEVHPEFICDVGIKKGEKIDYAIMKDGHPIMLVECKYWAHNLDLHDGQLLRYFHVSKAKFGVLTNGIVYRLYTDLVAPNKMDEKPFLEFDITDLKDNHIDEIKKFHKSYFNVENIVNTASELKYTNELKQLLHTELNNPTENFVRHFAKQVYPGVMTAKVLEQFTNLTKKSASLYISDLITDRLKSALNKETEANQKPAEQPQPENPIQKERIETTVEEMEAFFIVKSILRQKIDASRVVSRDAQSYFAILLDDNNRKTICRLYLGNSKKQIGLFDDQKKETKVEIQKLDDIFNYSASFTLRLLLTRKVKSSQHNYI